jgi:hypothetical protein
VRFSVKSINANIKLPVVPIQFFQSKNLVCDAEFYGFKQKVSVVVVGKSDDTQIIIWKPRHLRFVPRVAPAMLNDIVALV